MAVRKQATPSELKTLKRALKKLAPSKGLHFVYFDQGEEGSPVLMIDRIKIPAATVKAINEKARKKRPIKGTVRLGEGGAPVEFHPIKSPGKLQRSLKGYYGRLPLLKSARVVIQEDRDGLEARRDYADAEEVEAAEVAAQLKRREQQLADQLAALEGKEREAALEREDAEAAVKDNWKFWKTANLERDAELAQRKEEQRRWESEEVRKKLAALREELVRAEIVRQQKQEESEELKEIWDALQEQEWEARRQGSRAWRDDIHAQMDRLLQVSAVADRLDGEAQELEALQQRKAKEREAALEQIAALEARQRHRAERGERDTTLSGEESEQIQVLTERAEQLKAELDALAPTVDTARDAADEALARKREVEAERNAVFMTEGEQARAAGLRAEQEAAAARHEQQQEQLAAARDAEQQAHASLSAVSDAAREVERLRLALITAQFNVDELTDRSGKWTFFRKSRAEDKAAAQEALPAAQQKLAALQAQLSAAVAALEAREQEAGDSLTAAKEATAARLEVEQATAEAAAERARLDQAIAEETATVAEWHVDVRRQELERALAADPVLREATTARDFRANAAEEAADRMLDLQAELEALKAHNAALTGEMHGFSQVLDPDLTDALADNLQRLTGLAAKVETARRMAEKSAAVAAKAEEALQARIRERAEAQPELASALLGLRLAEQELERTVQSDAIAIDAIEDASDVQAEVERQRGVHALVVDGQAVVRSHGEIFEALRGRDLFDSRDADAVREAVGPAAAKIGAELDKLAHEMIQAGATAEELASVFERVPNGLRPAAYREETAAVDTLMRRFDELETLKTQKDRDDYLVATAKKTTPQEMKEKIKTILTELDTRRGDAQWASSATATVGKADGWLQMLGITDKDNPGEEKLSAVLGVLKQANFNMSIVGAGVSAGKAFTAENPDEDPILQKIQDQDKLKALNGLANAGIDIARQFVPILLTGKFGKGFIEDVVHSAARIYKASYDSKLQAIAKVHGSPLAGPLEESMNNELTLAEKYGFNAGLKAAAIATSVLNLTPATAVSFAVTLSTWTVGKSHNLLHSVRDWKEASKAKALLERVRAGDPKAKSTLLKHHAHYAKGMLALKAQEGDAFAMQYIGSRGLEEDEIRKSSLDIITRYLLQQSEQSSNPETFTEWLTERQAAFKRLADLVLVPLSYSWKLLFTCLSSPDRIGDIEVPLITVPIAEARELVAVIHDAIGLEERLRGRAETDPTQQEETAEAIEKVGKMIADSKSKVVKYRDRTAAQLKRISKVEQQFQEQMRAPLGLASASKLIMLGLQEHVPRLRMEHIELAGVLSEVV